jgi:sulfur carrier protein
VIVVVNGERRELERGTTVARVVELLDIDPAGRGVAVAVDGAVVSRSRWTQTEVGDGALVEIVAAIQGG